MSRTLRYEREQDARPRGHHVRLEAGQDPQWDDDWDDDDAALDDDDNDDPLWQESDDDGDDQWQEPGTFEAFGTAH